jgi:hypothetical protein
VFAFLQIVNCQSAIVNSSNPRLRQVLGWVAASISAVVAGFWAFWGSIENFHEGWYFTSLWKNFALMLGQYLSPMLIVMVVSVVALRWRRSALPIFGAMALGAGYLFRRAPAGLELVAIPLLILGGLYHFGRPEPRHWALRAVIWLPLLTAVVCGAYPGWRAVHRLDDGNYGMRLVEGNGVTLVWAPEGPGWPSHYASWATAKRGCAYLAADGGSLADTPQNLWRLPTIDEAVRSMVYRGRNAGGVWDPALQRAQYRVTPDKDSPLWKAHSQVIYWWTDTEVGTDRAYRIAYNGYVFAFSKRGWGDYWAYRCVRDE